MEGLQLNKNFKQLINYYFFKFQLNVRNVSVSSFSWSIWIAAIERHNIKQLIGAITRSAPNHWGITVTR